MIAKLFNFHTEGIELEFKEMKRNWEEKAAPTTFSATSLFSRYILESCEIRSGQ